MHRFFYAAILCLTIVIIFGIIFSGVIGGFIGGLLAGFLTGGITRGTLAGFIGGLFGALTLAFIEIIGFALFDETFFGQFLWASMGSNIVGLVVILAFLGILTSVVGGFIGGFLGLLHRGRK